MRTALLDLDGTLVDSAALITTHLSAALAGIGVPRTPRSLLPLVGPPFETALPALGLTPEQTVTVIDAYRATYDAVAATETPLYPGTVELLERLTADGLRLAVATSKPERVARRIVDGVAIAGFFTLVGGADQPGGRLGKAAVVGSVLQRLGIDPAREPVVMVGDRHHDVDGAGVFGIPTIGVAWGYAHPGELAGAAKIVADVDGLVDALTGDAHWSAPDPRVTRRGSAPSRSCG